MAGWPVGLICARNVQKRGRLGKAALSATLRLFSRHKLLKLWEAIPLRDRGHPRSPGRPSFYNRPIDARIKMFRTPESEAPSWPPNSIILNRRHLIIRHLTTPAAFGVTETFFFELRTRAKNQSYMEKKGPPYATGRNGYQSLGDSD